MRVGGGGERGTEISESAYYGGGSWYLNGWRAPLAEMVGRGKNCDNMQTEDMEVCVANDMRDEITKGDNWGRKRSSSRPSATRWCPRRPGCPQTTSGLRYMARGRRRMTVLSRENVMETGTATANRFIPGWKSNQDEEGGNGPVEGHVHGQDDGQVVRDQAGDVQEQGAGEGGGVAPGGEGGVRDGQGEGAGGGSLPDRGEGKPGDSQVGNDPGNTELEFQITDSKPRRKPKPMYFPKKRGIIPDGLVQTRLNHFRTLQKMNIDGGPGSANQSLEACQRGISTNGEGVFPDRKRKLNTMCPGNKRRREMSTCDS